MPNEFLIFFERPKKEHNPINFIKIMLFIKQALRNTDVELISLFMIIFSFSV